MLLLAVRVLVSCGLDAGWLAISAPSVTLNAREGCRGCDEVSHLLLSFVGRPRRSTNESSRARELLLGTGYNIPGEGVEQSSRWIITVTGRWATLTLNWHSHGQAILGN